MRKKSSRKKITKKRIEQMTDEELAEWWIANPPLPGERSEREKNHIRKLAKEGRLKAAFGLRS